MPEIFREMVTYGVTYTEGRASQEALLVKNPPASAWDLRGMGSIPGPGRFTGGGNGNSTPVSLPGECHGQRSLACSGSQGHKEVDTTEAT